MIHHVTNQSEITLNLENVEDPATYQDNKYINFEGVSTATESGCRDVSVRVLNALISKGYTNEIESGFIKEKINAALAQAQV